MNLSEETDEGIKLEPADETSNRIILMCLIATGIFIAVVIILAAVYGYGQYKNLSPLNSPV